MRARYQQSLRDFWRFYTARDKTDLTFRDKRAALLMAAFAPAAAAAFGGDTVNTASRLESYGAAGRIQVTQTTRDALSDSFAFEPLGTIDIKGLGPTQTYWLSGRTG